MTSIEMYIGLLQAEDSQRHEDNSDIFRFTKIPLPRMFRGTTRVVVHHGYKMEDVERSYNDIALVKFDRPFYVSSFTEAVINPICLPSFSSFNDEDKQSRLDYTL